MKFNRCMMFLTVFLIFIFMNPEVAKATTCSCRQHSAKAQGPGTCSRTEDKNLCTLAFSVTTQQEYVEFKNRLYKIGLDIDPRFVLQYSYKTRPDRWKPEIFWDYLTILFAISQRTHFTEYTAKTRNAIKPNSNKMKEVYQVFTNPGNRDWYKTIHVNGFTALVSFGCIELQKGDFSTMVKTRWSKGRCHCDDFR